MLFHSYLLISTFPPVVCPHGELFPQWAPMNLIFCPLNVNLVRLEAAKTANETRQIKWVRVGSL